MLKKAFDFWSYLILDTLAMIAIYVWAPAYAWWISALIVAIGFVVGNLAVDVFLSPVTDHRPNFWAELSPVVLAAVAGWVASWAFVAWDTTILLLDLLGLAVGLFMRLQNLYIPNVTVALSRQSNGR